LSPFAGGLALPLCFGLLFSAPAALVGDGAFTYTLTESPSCAGHGTATVTGNTRRRQTKTFGHRRYMRHTRNSAHEQRIGLGFIL